MITEALVVGQGRIRRRRDKAEFLFRHRLRVEVSEVEPSDAPTAVIVERTETDVYRRHAGGFWLPLHGIGHRETVGVDAFPGLVSGEGASAWTRNPFSKQGRKTASVPAPTEVRWAIEEDGLEDAELVAKAACWDLLFVGGVLHRRVAEPVWRVSYTMRERIDPASGAALPWWNVGLAVDHDARPAEFWTSARFRIDAVAEVMAFLSALPEREQQRSVPDVAAFGPLGSPLVEAGAPAALPPLPGLASMPNDVLASFAMAADAPVPDLGRLGDLMDRLARVAGEGGAESCLARRLVSDIAFPVVLGRLHPTCIGPRDA